MTLRDHPLWPALRPFFRVQLYGRDGGPTRPRFRLEVKGLPPTLHAPALGVEVHCAAGCGRWVHPIRARVGSGHKRTAHVGNLYYANSCPLAVCVGCSRGDKAHLDYVAMRAAIEGGP